MKALCTEDVERRRYDEENDNALNYGVKVNDTLRFVMLLRWL